jgi:rod shape-determining protein MreD
MQSREMDLHEILLPVRGGFIVFTFVAALLINLLPWSGWALVLKPDFVALVVLYWCIQQPRKVGFTSAWLLGLIMDVAEGSLFGQHALAYSVLAFGGIVLHRRVLMF